MSYLKNIIIASLCVLSAPSLFAGVDVPIYQASVPVASTSASERQTAMEAAFNDAVIKISGDPQAITNEVIESHLTQSSSYVQRYSYTKQKHQNDDNDSLQLNVQFDATAMRQLLAEANVPIWGDNRPDVLVWSVFNTVDGLSLEDTAEGPSPFMQSLTVTAEKRGIPLLFPTLDLTTLTELTPEVVWNANMPVIQDVSSPYNAAVLLIVRLDEHDLDRVIAEADLWIGKEKESFTFSGDDPSVLGKTVADQVANTLASRFSVDVDDAPQQTITITVTNVDTNARYAQVVRYLHALDMVSQVSMVSADADAVTFNIDVVGGVDKFKETIALDHRLLPKGDQLIYQWSAHG